MNTLDPFVCVRVCCRQFSTDKFPNDLLIWNSIIFPYFIPLDRIVTTGRLSGETSQIHGWQDKNHVHLLNNCQKSHCLKTHSIHLIIKTRTELFYSIVTHCIQWICVFCFFPFFATHIVLLYWINQVSCSAISHTHSFFSTLTLNRPYQLSLYLSPFTFSFALGTKQLIAVEGLTRAYTHKDNQTRSTDNCVRFFFLQVKIIRYLNWLKNSIQRICV